MSVSEKPQIGRPRKPVGEVRPHKITVALTDEELADLEEYRRKQPSIPTRAAACLEAIVFRTRTKKRA